MTVFSNLLVNGQPIALISYSAESELSAVGRATFTVEKEVAIGSLVNFDIGIGERVHRFSSYYVESVTPTKNGFFSIFCREFMELLWSNGSLALRHVTAREVLKAIENKSKVKMINHNAGYLDNETPYFYSCKTLFHALESMGRVFNIKKYCFTQYPDGSVWAGSVNDLPESELVLNLSDSLLKPLGVPVPDIYRFSMVSGLRVGAVINGKRIKKLAVSDSMMVATCIKL